MSDRRHAATTVVLAAIIAIVFYSAGYGHAASRAMHRERALAEAVQSAHAQLAASTSRTDLLGARIALYRVADAIGQQNPAMANDRLEEASSDLASVDVRSAGLSAARFSVVQNELRAIGPVSLQDSQAQLGMVQKLGGDLDKLISASAAPPPAPGSH